MRFKNLEKYKTGGSGSKLTLSIPAPKTPDGRVYRYSPNERAFPRHFLIGDCVGETSEDEYHRSRMRQQPGLPQTICPYSGVCADDDEFMHPDDIEAATQIVGHEVLKDTHGFLENMAKGFNRRQSKGGLFSMNMSVKSRRKTAPRFFRRDLMRELVCDHCGRDFAVFALSLFCPDCGAPTIALNFSRERDLASNQVEIAQSLEDQEELAYRLLGNAHEDVLTAFEATLKAVYLHRRQLDDPDAERPKVGNAFQNIERTQKFLKEWDFDPFAVLEDDELSTLALNIQKRHIIGHNLSVADEKFVDQATDAKVGETVALVGDDILQFAETCLAVVRNVDDWLAGQEVPETPAREELSENMSSENRTDLVIADEYGLTELAVKLARFLCLSSETGMKAIAHANDIQSGLAEYSKAELREAFAELQVDGYIKTLDDFNSELPDVWMNTELFSAFDPSFTEHDPQHDAAVLARMVLNADGGTNVEEFHQQTGWLLRRFNPAIAIMLEQIDEGRISGAMCAKYPTSFFTANDEDRVWLRRFAERFEC